MKAVAAAERSGALVQLQEPDHGYRNYGCYATWPDAIRRLRGIDVQRRHLYELIPHGHECKPYLDLDGPPLPRRSGASTSAHAELQLHTVEDVVERASELVTALFRSDYGVELLPEHLVWLDSPQEDKLSLHLTISTHGPQYVYSSNHRTDPSGAWHLASRLRQLDPSGIGAMVDVSVYSKDREMRTLGGVKHGRPGSSALRVMQGGEGSQSGAPEQVQPADGRVGLTVAAAREALITWLDEPAARRRLEVPPQMPAAVLAQQRGLRTQAEAAQLDPEMEESLLVVRMQDLMRERLHDTAYVDRLGRDSAVMRMVLPGTGAIPVPCVRFSYTDRSEPCYTGNVHEGRQNLRCYVDGGGIVHARCFSPHCSAAAPLRLGRLRAESDAHLSGAVHVDDAYLDMADERSEFGPAVRRWLDREARALSVRSPMGSGKSTFLDGLLRELGNDVSVLVVTYRQSLAYEHMRKMRGHGFVSYLDWPASERPDLGDRTAFPRVICQIESLRLLGGGPFLLPSFDVIVLDESESLLRHFGSPTVPNPMYSADKFAFMLQHARRGVVTLDATWGPLTHAVLHKAQLSNILIVNDRAPDARAVRTFAVSNDAARWAAEIGEDLAAGLNVVVVSLSAEKADEVLELASAIVGADACVLHSSKSDDELKKQLRDVDALWTRFRVVIYTPTICAGVDFSSEHFHRMYVYVCTMSAPPSALMQMMFRVRKLRDVRVRCLAAQRMRMALGDGGRAALSSADMVVWLRWMSKSMRVLAPDTQQQHQHQPTALSRGGQGAVLNGTSSTVQLVQSTLDAVLQRSPDSTPVACLPQLSYWLLIMSYVEAELYNSRGDYLRELAGLAEDAGHLVVVERVKAASSPSAVAAELAEEENASEVGADASTASESDVAPLSRNAQRLLAAAEGRPSPDGAEVEELRQKASDNRATSADKYRLKLSAYLASWGIDKLDADFVRTNGTEIGSPRAKLLARLLCPSLRPQRDADVSMPEKSSIFKVVLVAETVRALGVKSPLDCETVIDDLMDVFARRLAGTEMFRNYDRTSQLFRGSEGGVKLPWDLRKVVKAVNMVLGAAGLKVKAASVKRSSMSSVRKTTYTIDPSAVASITELVKLRLRRAEHKTGVAPVVENEHARAVIEACTFPTYGRLLSAATPMADFVDESDSE